MEALTNGLPQEHCYVNILRDAMAVDACDPCGIYFWDDRGKSTRRQMVARSWTSIVSNLPGCCR